MTHLSLLLFVISLFSTLLIPSYSKKCGLKGLTASAVDNGEAAKLHNQYRNIVNEGKVPNQPKAQHLDNLQYDEALAQAALNIAKTCQYLHVTVKDARFQVGQNLHRICAPSGPEAGFDQAVKAWYDQHKLYRYGDSFALNTGHYTQLMWQYTKYVGCAYSQWEEMQGKRRNFCKLVVCHYGPAGNWKQNPYDIARA